jgi:hypothetical protein
MIETGKLVAVTPPGAIVDAAALTTNVIDTLGFDYCRIIVYLGATDIAMTALKVQESDVAASATALTGGTDITGTDFSVSPATLPGAGDDNKFFIIDIDLRGRKRYLDVAATGGDGTAGAYITILAQLLRASQVPATAAARGAAQALNV